ncbi:unnamed protein product, partial [Gongylonema pulchrum]|uniref:VWFA domain-containing protein n=1 Tax=Gongylonema pulchrum TaxID=637853 RepID=A0A183E952_9BILA
MGPNWWLKLILLLQAVRIVNSCADVVFVLDGSASVKEHFQQMIDVASELAMQFDVENKGYQIAILEYSGKAILPKWLDYHFGSIRTNEALKTVIKNLPHMRGAADTGRALGIVLHEYLRSRRPGLPFIVFTITDGYYRDPEEVLKNVLSLATQPNVQLFAATASKRHNRNPIRESSEMIARSARYAPTIVESTTIQTTTSIKTHEDNLSIKPACLLDVVFLMDFSDGASDKRQTYIDLVSALTSALNLGQTSAQ